MSIITIYGKTACSYCNAAKQLCETRGYEYEYKQLDVDFTREDVFETFPGARTFNAASWCVMNFPDCFNN